MSEMDIDDIAVTMNEYPISISTSQISSQTTNDLISFNDFNVLWEIILNVTFCIN